MKRRNFIQKSALATTGTMMIPAFLKAFELQRTVNPEAAHPIVVIIQLSGGNDGLNTIIPYQNDLYY
ncbi:MAG: twin-arginine translocation pathway signal, partial [Bacteroidota bacterium]